MKVSYALNPESQAIQIASRVLPELKKLEAPEQLPAEICVEEPLKYPFPRGFLFSVCASVNEKNIVVMTSIKEKYGNAERQLSVGHSLDAEEIKRQIRKSMEFFADVTYLSQHPLTAPTRKSRAKYKPGPPITSIEELLATDQVYFQGKNLNKEVILSWQFRMVQRAIAEKWLLAAVKKEDADDK